MADVVPTPIVEDGPHTMAGLLKPLRGIGWKPGAVIDIGVEMGTPGLYTTWPDAQICLIEPSPEAAAHMAEIAAAYPNVQVFNVGASNKTGEIKARHHPSMLNIYLGTGKNSWPETAIPVRTCDDIVAEARLTPPFVYKLDTDSHELEILEGSAKTLEQTELCIIELNLYYGLKDMATPADIWKVMTDKGFVLFGAGSSNFADSGLMKGMDVAFARKDGELFRLASQNLGKRANLAYPQHTRL